MNKDSKIFLAGHRGLVGSAILRKLEKEGFTNITVKGHKEVDLTRQEEVEKFFMAEKFDYVFLAAAKVGGILANDTYPADFIYQNIMIASNVIDAAHKSGVKKLLNLGSSCIYPKFAKQPMKEEYLLTGELEPTNEAYALAKIAAIKLCKYYNKQYGCNFISLMPTNMYGPNDNFDLETSHVMPALIRKFVEAKENGTKVTLWGSGKPRREFLYSDDLADACVYLMNNKDASEVGDFVNIGTGKDVEIKELASMIQSIVGFEGEVEWDTSKPDGTMQKLQDVTLLHSLGWKHKIELNEGLSTMVNWFKENR